MKYDVTPPPKTATKHELVITLDDLREALNLWLIKQKMASSDHVPSSLPKHVEFYMDDEYPTGEADKDGDDLYGEALIVRWESLDDRPVQVRKGKKA